MPDAVLAPETVLSTDVTWSDCALTGSLSAVFCVDAGEWPRTGEQGAMLQVTGEGDSDPRRGVEEVVNSGLIWI